jgi:hypothetical protein
VSYIKTRTCLAQAGEPKSCAERLDQARSLFSLFHCFPPAEVIWKPCPRLIPRVLVQLGHLRGLIYSSNKGTQGRRRTYIHFMEKPPRLTCNPQGTQLYIVGGNYRVTPRGIEG